MCPLGYCSRELCSWADNSLRKYRQYIRKAAHFRAVVKSRMVSSVYGTYTVLFPAPDKHWCWYKAADVFLAQDKPSRDAHLNSQKGHVSAMEIHPGRLCALTGQAAG